MHGENDFDHNHEAELRRRPKFRKNPDAPHADGQRRRRKPLHISWTNMDITIYLVVTILVIIGVIMVFSASYQMATHRVIFNNDPFFFLRRNGIFALLGFAAMNVIARINVEYYRRFVWVLYFGVIISLIAVIFFGQEVGGAARWVNIPIIGAGFQPSEIAKAAIIFVIAHLVDKYPGALKSWSNLAVFSALVGGPILLILLPGGFSTALIVAAIGFGMIFIASPYIWRFIIPGGLAVGAAATYLIISMQFGLDFRGARIQAWLDPWSLPSGTGFQTIQSLYAVATGGWFGEGIGQSRQASFLPEPHHDMIFAIIVEEIGLIGAGLILVLFGILIWRGIIVAMRAENTFSSMIAIGVVLAIAFQTVINVGVVTNTIPNTGVTLPFISYGGTSLLINMALAGVLLSISRFSREGSG